MDERVAGAHGPRAAGPASGCHPFVLAAAAPAVMAYRRWHGQWGAKAPQAAGAANYNGLGQAHRGALRRRRARGGRMSESIIRQIVSWQPGACSSTRAKTWPGLDSLLSALRHAGMRWNASTLDWAASALGGERDAND